MFVGPPVSEHMQTVRQGREALRLDRPRLWRLAGIMVKRRYVGIRQSGGNTNASLRLRPYLSLTVLLCECRERKHVHRFRCCVRRWRGKALSDDRVTHDYRREEHNPVVTGHSLPGDFTSSM